LGKMINIITIILGLLFVLFIPGYLLSLIILKKLNLIERICLSFGLSVVIVVFLSFFLTAIGYFLKIRAITAFSVWLSLLILSLFFTIVLIIFYRNNAKKA
jgi:uncharacterized membrane protein